MGVWQNNWRTSSFGTVKNLEDVRRIPDAKTTDKNGSSVDSLLYTFGLLPRPTETRVYKEWAIIQLGTARSVSQRNRPPRKPGETSFGRSTHLRAALKAYDLVRV